MANKNTGRGLFFALGILQVFIGVAAVGGGWALIMDQTGTSMGWTTAQLDGSPFPNYLVPGLFLFAVNGVGTLAAAAMSFRRQKHAGVVAIFLGVVLMTWIGIQIVIVGVASWLQPFTFVLGLLEAVLGVFVYRRQTAVSNKVRFP